jgi:hypothetical protein
MQFESSRIKLRPLEFVLGALIVAGIYLRFMWGDDFTYSVFTDRDLLRGLYLWDDFQYLGAESTFHLSRTPGGAVAYFFNFFQQFHTSANFVHGATVFMDALALVLIPILFAPYLGRTPALMMAAFYGVSLTVLEEMWKFWNPSLSPLFAVLIIWLTFKFILDERLWALPTAFFLIGVVSQFHMSFYILVPMLVFVVLVTRPRTSFKVWAASLGMLIFSMLPYLIGDGLNDFENTLNLIHAPQVAPPSVPDDEMDVSKLLLGILRITGGRSFPAQTLPEVLLSSPLLYWVALFVFNIGFAALLVSVGVLAVNLLFGPHHDAAVYRRLQIALILLVVVGAFIASKNANNVQGRYHIVWLMPALLVIGFGFQVFFRWAEQQSARRIYDLLVVGVLVVLSAKCIAIAYYYNTSPREANSAYSIKRDIVTTLKNDFGWTSSDIEYKVALWLEPSGAGRRAGNNPWDTFDDDENSGLTYIARTIPDQSSGQRMLGCMIVQMPERIGSRLNPLDVPALVRALPDSKGFTIGKLVEKHGLRFVGYSTDNPNCVRSYGNAYLQNEHEKLAEKSATGMKPLTAKSISPDGRIHRFVVQLPNNSAALLEIAPEDGGTMLTLHANALRGHARSFRITRARMSDFEIILKSLETKNEYRIKESGSIGVDGRQTPWRIEGPVIPPGRYNVAFKVETFLMEDFYNWGLVKSGPHIVTLAETLVWE